MFMQLLQTIAVLSAVLALIFLLAYVLRRLKLTGQMGEMGNEGWRILSVKHLGPRRQIFVMEVGKRILLIGVTDRTMNSLMEISDPTECETLREAVGRKKRTAAGFRDFLHRAEQR